MLPLCCNNKFLWWHKGQVDFWQGSVPTSKGLCPLSQPQSLGICGVTGGSNLCLFHIIARECRQPRASHTWGGCFQGLRSQVRRLSGFPPLETYPGNSHNQWVELQAVLFHWVFHPVKRIGCARTHFCTADPLHLAINVCLYPKKTGNKSEVSSRRLCNCSRLATSLRTKWLCYSSVISQRSTHFKGECRK